jgi:hypothetical protein
MNRRSMSLLLVMALSAMMVACATPPERKSPTETNAEYVGALERVSGRVGARIIWVNPPRRARVSEDNET